MNFIKRFSGDCLRLRSKAARFRCGYNGTSGR